MIRDFVTTLGHNTRVSHHTIHPEVIVQECLLAHFSKKMAKHLDLTHDCV